MKQSQNNKHNINKKNGKHKTFVDKCNIIYHLILFLWMNQKGPYIPINNCYIFIFFLPRITCLRSFSGDLLITEWKVLTATQN